VVAKLFTAVFLFILSLFLLPSYALADQLILNGGFSDGLSGWVLSNAPQRMKAVWDGAGCQDRGSLNFKLANRGSRDEAYITERITEQIQSGSQGTLSFAWKKNWSSILPLQQRIYIDLIKPDKSTVTLWENREILNNNSWESISIDISRFLDQSGNYALRIGALFENGNAKKAAAYAWFDDIRMDIQIDKDSAPQTALLYPIGARELSGDIQSISGISVDNNGIAKVEIALVRLYDNFYWNGNSWVKNEHWNPVKIISSNRKNRMVSWRYLWPLPTSDGASFKIEARATDAAGNLEKIPAKNFLNIDNVGPTGKIFIEGPASYTNNRLVHVKADVRGAKKMRFSVDNGQTWSRWTEFSPTTVLTLPEGDGIKIVSGQFKDASGNLYQTSDNITLDMTPPVTKHIFPSANATGILPDSSISIVFYENMDPLSFKNDGTEEGSTVYIKQGTHWIPANTSYDNKTKTAKLIPKRNLDTGATYTVYLTTGIKDAAGNPLAANFSWSFTTVGSPVSSFRETIGAAGGKLEDANQLISLEIPQNALTKDTLITIEESKAKNYLYGIDKYSPIFRIKPYQLSFNVPATLKVKYRPDEVPDPTSLRLMFYDMPHKRWLPVDNSRIDLAHNQIIAPISGALIVTITAQNDMSPPYTSIVAPTGMERLKGINVSIYGVSVDNVGISEVEIEIVRLDDGSYWNGSSWQSFETWLKAKMVSGKDKPNATWSYSWQSPKKATSNYRIRARAIDESGNIELNPAILQIDFID